MTDHVAQARSCESGCGCRYGTEDPDVRDCACDGPCAFAEHDVWFHGGAQCPGMACVTQDGER